MPILPSSHPLSLADTLGQGRLEHRQHAARVAPSPTRKAQRDGNYGDDNLN